MPVSTETLLAQFKTLHPSSIDLSLERIQRLLARLRHPERSLGGVVHVAGTNGKGTVTALLSAVQRASGRRTNTYVSPHFLRFHERILIDGKPIGDRALRTALEEVESTNANDPITFFEIVTAAAMVAFRNSPADITVLETGLGGRLDATNVVNHPLLCVITPVALDHRERLGATLARIANEKAGILKPGTPVVVGAQRSSAARVIKARAEAVSASLRRKGIEWNLTRRRGALIYRDNEGERELPAAPGEGRHLEENVGIVAAALAVRPELSADDEAVAQAFHRFKWPGRLQRIESIAMKLSPGTELWVDGGHNPAAARALAAWARNGPPVHLVAGLREGKDADGFLKAFRNAARSLAAVPLEMPCWCPERLAEMARMQGIPGRAFASIEEGLADAARRGSPCRVLACGSFLLVAKILAQASSKDLSIQL